MKALITAGGRATRLRPITWTVNKHLVPLANKPMISFAIEKIAEAGIKEVGIIINVGDTEIAKALGDGSAYGVSLTYIEQVGGPVGFAQGVNLAREFLADEPFVLYLGDNIILGSIGRFVEKFEREKLNCLLALSKVKDPQRFGVPEIKDGKILRVEEKPQNPKSDYAVTGIYVYDKHFFDAFQNIKPSARGEYDISDIHTWLIEHGHSVGYEEITGWWKDTGTPYDLLEGNALLLNERAAWNVRIEGEVSSGAVIRGAVSIGKGAKIGPSTVIRGPVAIGENAKIDNAYIGPYTSIGNDVTVEGAEIEYSMVFDGAVVRPGCRVVDSLIGKNAVIERNESILPKGHKLIVGDNARVEL